MKIELVLKDYQGDFNSPEVQVNNLGFKSVFFEGRNGAKRVQGLHLELEGSEKKIMEILNELSLKHEIYTNL